MSKYAVINPATGETVKEYATATDAEISAAIDAAHAAARGWARTTTREERAALVTRVAELHRERRQELAEIIVREMGKPIGDALGEVDFSADIYQYYADNGPGLLADEPVDLAEGSEGSAFIRKSALGVLLGIMPWNFPYYQVARFAGPNLVLGNTIILKHAAQCPASAEAIQQIFLDAGFPEGAYVNVYATNDQIGTIIADSRVRPSPSRPAVTSRRSCSSSAAATPSSCSRPTTSTGPSSRPSTRASTTAASRATARSASSSSTSSTTPSSRSSSPR
jgi:succinate-semialdehyde dehydrogenase/glutarate-semialdehyde dehydrogenase